MADSLLSRAKSAWNAFFNRAPTNYYKDQGMTYSYRPDRPRLSRGNERTIVTSVYNRIALDVASLVYQHVYLDENGRFLGPVNSKLNNCLTIEANIDQTASALFHDIAMSMCDEGCVAVVPVDTTANPVLTDSYDIRTMRTGKITKWKPRSVEVQVYNDRTGQKEEVELPKHCVSIIENPFYAVMNEHNSTMQRLIRKLALLDSVDEQSSSGKLDLIIQLPYTVKTETKRQLAENRRKDIESQLTGSKYGIAYTDATERITQLNRPVENNLLKQIESLTSMLYSQLNINQSILDGTADEKTMNNYYNRTVNVIARAIVDEMKRKFISRTARTQGQSILFFRNLFELASVSDLAESADKFTRNEIMSKNEFRQLIGLKPSDDPKADQLINSNISQPSSGMNVNSSSDQYLEEGGEIQNE